MKTIPWTMKIFNTLLSNALGDFPSPGTTENLDNNNKFLNLKKIASFIKNCQST